MSALCQLSKKRGVQNVVFWVEMGVCSFRTLIRSRSE
jgi:hypothetical protein